MTSQEAPNKACVRCRQLKLACRRGDDDDVCARCVASCSECVYVARRRGPSTPSLTDKLADIEVQFTELRSDVNSPGGLRARLERVERQLQLLSHQTPASTELSVAKTQTQPPPRPEPDIAVESLDRASLAVTGSMRDARGEHDEAVEWRTDGLTAELEAGCREAFQLFGKNCQSTLNFCDPGDPCYRFEEARKLSPLLFWSIVAVGSRTDEAMETVYHFACQRMVASFKRTLGGPVTFWDLLGAIIKNRYFATMRNIGHILDMTYDLDVHTSFRTPSAHRQRDVRMWIAVWVQDYFATSITGRPSFISDTVDMAAQAQWLVNHPDAIPNDRRLVATFEYGLIVHSVMHGREADIPERLGAIEAWFNKWLLIAFSQSTSNENNSMLSSTRVNYHFAKLVVNSLALRGIHDAIPPSLMQHFTEAVNCARELCTLCRDDFGVPRIYYTGEPHIYSFVSAAVFLMKARRLAPTLVPNLFAEVQKVIDVLRHLVRKPYASTLVQLLSTCPPEDHVEFDLDAFSWPGIGNVDVDFAPFESGLEDIFGMGNVFTGNL